MWRLRSMWKLEEDVEEEVCGNNCLVISVKVEVKFEVEADGRDGRC